MTMAKINSHDFRTHFFSSACYLQNKHDFGKSRFAGFGASFAKHENTSISTIKTKNMSIPVKVERAREAGDYRARSFSFWIGPFERITFQ